jgi:hypothetical protein
LLTKYSPTNVAWHRLQVSLDALDTSNFLASNSFGRVEVIKQCEHDSSSRFVMATLTNQVNSHICETDLKFRIIHPISLKWVSKPVQSFIYPVWLSLALDWHLLGGRSKCERPATSGAPSARSPCRR